MSQPDELSPPPASGFEPPSAEELGAMLPHYEIEYLIASGGMGAVYKGRQVDLDRLVAIKVLPPEAGNDADSIARFRSEARAMAKLNHTNIVSIYDFGVENDQCFFVMEFVEGRNVHELILARGISVELAYHIVAQICDALTYAHGKGIVHGDIKPANIVVDADGVVKLLDFGLARLIDHSSSQADAWSPMGTPEYAAPELFQKNARCDHRADIYSLGIVLYEMLVGHSPKGKYPVPSSVIRVPTIVDELVVRCLHPNPAQRIQTTADIKKVISGLTSKGSAPTPKPVTIVRPRARRAPVATGQGRSTRRLPAATSTMPRATRSLVRPTPAHDPVMHRINAQQHGRNSAALIWGIVAGVVVVALLFLLALNNNSSSETNQGSAPAEKQKPARDTRSSSDSKPGAAN